MKRILTCLAVFFLLPACGENPEEGTAGSDFDESRATFEQARDRADGDYVYAIEFASWTGYASRTTIYVEGGAVVRRTVSVTAEPDGGGMDEQFDENGDEVGSNQAGARPLTLDALYSECADTLALDPTENELVFTTDESGIVQSCYAVPENCADDCNMGFTLDFVDFGLE